MLESTAHALQENERRASFLAEASRILATSLDYEQTLQNIAHLAVPEFADWCEVDLVDEDGTVRPVAVAHPNEELVQLVEMLRERYPPDPDAPLGVQNVLRTGRAEYLEEIPDELLVAGAVDEEHLRYLRELDLQSYMIAPLMARDKVLGVISFAYTKSKRRYTEADLALAEELGRRAGTAIENARLLQEVEQRRADAQQQAVQLELQAEELEKQARSLEEKAAELQHLNDELSASRARLEATLNSSLDAIVTIDAHDRILDWNRNAEDLFGWSRAEAIGKTLVETIIPARFQEDHLNGIRRYLDSGEHRLLNRRIETTALRRDGEEFPIELTVVPAASTGRVLFISFIRDLTERKRFESHRNAEHNVTRVLAESVSLSDAAPRVLEAIGDALGWEVANFWVLDTEANKLAIAGMWHAPGSEAPAFADATRHARYELGEGLPGYVWELRRPVWITEIARSKHLHRHASAAAEGLQTAVAFPVLAGDEFLGVIEVFHRQVMREDEDLLGTVESISREIAQAMKRIRAETERDEALHELERINEHLREANRALSERTSEAESANRAKSDFLANMSHEFRTPINAIVGYTDLLAMGITGSVTDAQREHLARIKESSRHLLGLVEEVLDLSKIESGRIEIANERARLGDPIEAALALVAPQAASAGIELSNRCDDAGGEQFTGDEDRVRQILLNLLSNAVKFTESGGSVVVSCERTEQPDPEATLNGEGPWLAIRVQDTGMGIPEDQMSAIFEPFVQLSAGRTRKQGGTGLGLAISRRLARLMGGDLTARSEVGEGSTFTLWLTVATDQAIGAGEATLPVEFDSKTRAELPAVGERLKANVDAIISRVNTRLREDPLTPLAARLSDPELRDHQPTLVTDMAELLSVIGDTTREPELLVDGADIQRLISIRHGDLRARQGWTEAGLRREFEILREEIERVALENGALDPDVAGSVRSILAPQLKGAEDAAALRLKHRVG